MPSFTLREFERTGPDKTGELRVLGERQQSASTVMEGKQWLSTMLAERRLESGRLYRFDAVDCSTHRQSDYLVNIAFYLFPDGRLCPLRIWARAERFEAHAKDPAWTADFEGVPGWSLIGFMEPRWRLLRTVPAERSWLGRSWRDWQKRDCWVTNTPIATPINTPVTTPVAGLQNRAAWRSNAGQDGTLIMD